MITELRWTFTRIFMKRSDQALEIITKWVLVKLEDHMKVRGRANAGNAGALTLQSWDHYNIVKPRVLHLGRWNPEILHLGTKNKGTPTETCINSGVPREVIWPLFTSLIKFILWYCIQFWYPFFHGKKKAAFKRQKLEDSSKLNLKNLFGESHWYENIDA